MAEMPLSEIDSVHEFEQIADQRLARYLSEHKHTVFILER